MAASGNGEQRQKQRRRLLVGDDDCHQRRGGQQDEADEALIGQRLHERLQHRLARMQGDCDRVQDVADREAGGGRQQYLPESPAGRLPGRRRSDVAAEGVKHGTAGGEAQRGGRRVEGSPMRRLALGEHGQQGGRGAQQHGDRKPPGDQRGEAERDRGDGRLQAGPARRHDRPDLAEHDHARQDPEQRMVDEVRQVHHVGHGDHEYRGAHERHQRHVDPQRRAEARADVPGIGRVLHGSSSAGRSALCSTRRFP